MHHGSILIPWFFFTLMPKPFSSHFVNFKDLLTCFNRDILPMFMGDKVIENGTIFLPAGDGKSTFVSCRDFAATAANLRSG